MNPAYNDVLAAGSETMLSAFDTTALRLGTASQNIEKDFWVCWTLDALFNGLKNGGPRLLFKGGTSWSKGFGLISRFSEDIDVTVFRDDIGESAAIEELNSLSGKKRRARLDAIKDACQAYINGSLRAELTAILKARLDATGLGDRGARVEADDADPDGHPGLNRPVTGSGNTCNATAPKPPNRRSASRSCDVAGRFSASSVFSARMAESKSRARCLSPEAT